MGQGHPSPALSPLPSSARHSPHRWRADPRIHCVADRSPADKADTDRAETPPITNFLSRTRCPDPPILRRFGAPGAYGQGFPHYPASAPMFSEHISGFAISGRRQPVLHAHVQPTAGGDVQHRVAGLLDHRQKLHEHGRVRGRAAIARVTRVQMQNRRPSLGRRNRVNGGRISGQVAE